MASRSFRNVLGETKLELKCLLLFGACLLVLIAASFYVYGSRTEKLVFEQNREAAKGMAKAILVTLHWDWMNKFKETNPQLENFAMDFSKSLMESQPFKWTFIRPDSDDEKYEAQDDYDREVLERFLRAERPATDDEHKQEYVFRQAPGKDEYHYYEAIRAKKQTCLLCHGQLAGPGQRVLAQLLAPSGKMRAFEQGEVMAVVKIAVVPGEETEKALAENNAILWGLAIITVFLAVMASYLIIRSVIVKPLKHLRDVSDEVSRGNVNLRAEIHTGDEFEDLGAAFNRMLRHLVDAQDKLRTANTNLDGKVDELAQANMRLYELNRLKSDFLATMSHELRTPLNSIIGFSDVLGSIDALDDKQRRYVLNIQKSGRVLLDMINDILDLAKLESGKMEVRLSEFRIDQVITAQCDMARPLTEKKNIDLEVNVPPGLPPLFQDQGKVQQVLNNLLSNAIKFTPEGGRIVISAKRSPHDDLILTVTDTGVGIAEEDQVAIFEKFRQGQTSASGGDAMTREFSGTGLGLSIVKELCKLLGGEISLESQLGRGSTFIVRLPWIGSPPQPKLETPLGEELEELLRPRRADLRRAADRAVPATPAAGTS